jgi:hypothetical protein
MILTGGEMKSLEDRAFASGASAEALMEEAGRKIAEVVQQFCRGAGRCVVFFGKGHTTLEDRTATGLPAGNLERTDNEEARGIGGLGE